MLEQLDLFTISPDVKEIDRGTTPEPKKRKLVPPQVILQEKKEQTETEQEAPVASRQSHTLFNFPEPHTESPADHPIQQEESSPQEEEGTPSHPSAQIGIFLEIKPESANRPKSGRGRKPQREQPADSDMQLIPGDRLLYSKSFYAAGEVAAMFKITTSQLRYWESEFDILEPRKNGKGETYYRPDDIKNLQKIYSLLHHQKMTVEAARGELRKPNPSLQKQEVIQQLEQLKRFLMEMKADLLS